MTFVPKDNWENRPRYNLTVRIPHGYKTDPDDPTIFVPDLEAVEKIEKALDYIDDGNPFRVVSEWLTKQLGRKISHTGIREIWKRYRLNQKGNERAKQFKQEARKRRPKTKEEAELLKVKRKVQGSKRALTVHSKKLESLTAPAVIPSSDKGQEAEKIDIDPTEGREVAFRPNDGPQTDFLAATEQEVLYGGAAGGGKSYAMLADPMRYFDNSDFNGILFRKTNDELRELKTKSRGLYMKAFPEARWKGQESQWVFPSGATLWLTYLDRDEDVERYQGQAFTWIGFDELGHWATPYAWDYMRSRLRSTNPDIPLSQRATANPGGVGGGWIKKTFIDPAPFGVAFDARDLETGETLIYPPNHAKAGQPLFKRRFIPAKLYDNPYLAEDGRYEASLLSLTENTRRQLLDGDWSVFDGAAFPEFRLKDHVIDPYEIPSNWRRFRSCDYGYNSFSAVHWFAIDPAYETLIVYRELYVTKKTGRQLARLVLDLEQGENITYGVLDSSVWHQRGQTGPSIAEEMIAEGCRWRPADRSAGSRSNGKNRFHEVLSLRQIGEEEDGTAIMKPGIQFFNTCRQIIADLPALPADPKGTDDIDPKYASDHAYDSVRYGIMSRPRSTSVFDFVIPTGGGYRPADMKFGY